MIALQDSGLPDTHPALVQAGRWLLREQVLTGGDWQVKAKGVEPGGWSFEFENDIYPDTDDTAAVMIALARTELPEARKALALERGVHWLRGMQSANGGWGAFDKDNTRRIVNEIPFCDFGEVIDPPSEDVTAHALEALALFGLLAAGGASDGIIAMAVQRGAGYLVETQEEDGQWLEDEFTGTGFPGDFYIKYHLYRNYWPLMALGRYASRMSPVT